MQQRKPQKGSGGGRQTTEWEKIVSNNATDNGLHLQNILTTHMSQTAKKQKQKQKNPQTTHLKHGQNT